MYITRHAKQKFQQLTGCKTLDRAEFRIQKLFDKAVEVERLRAEKAIIANRFRAAEYFRYNNWIFVVVNKRLVTCYTAQQANFREIYCG